MKEMSERKRKRGKGATAEPAIPQNRKREAAEEEKKRKRGLRERWKRV